MASNPSPLAQILKAARENDIHLSETDIRTLKNAPPTSKLGEWVNDFPSQHKDNTDTYTLTRPSQPNSKTPLSTQRSILEQQASLLSAHAKIHFSTATGSSRGFQAHGDRISTLRRKYESQSQHAYHTNVARSAEIRDDLRRRAAGVEKRRAELHADVTRTLKKFDAVLGDLRLEIDALALDDSGLDVGLGETKGSGGTPTRQRATDSDMERMEKLFKVLEKETTKELKDRLDTVYLTALNSPLHDVSAAHVDENGGVDQHQTEEKREGDLRNLRAEIDMLYTEISPVAAMVVDSAHGKPLRRALHLQREAQRKRRNATLLQTKGRLEMMTATLEDLRRRVEENRSQGVVLKRMLGWVQRLEREVEKMPSRTLLGKAADLSARARDTRDDEGYIGDEMGRLDLNDDSGQKKEEEVVVNKMREVVYQRRQAVDDLIRAVDYKSDEMRAKEEEVRGLEQRIIVVKEGLTRVTR